MRSFDMITKTTIALAVATSILTACGADSPTTQGRLLAPETGHTRMTLAPALDVSSIVDPELLDRLVIDEVIVNVEDVRLLGADPRLPSGGLRLLAGQRQVSTRGEAETFPLPAGLTLEDLALFVRLQPTPELDGASVIVRARLYADARLASIQTLRQRSEPDPDGSPAYDPQAEPDPDGSPAATDPDKEPDPDGSPAAPRKEEPDPDGSPAHGGGKKGDVCEPDPDGSPAMRPCKGASKRSAVVAGEEFIYFELRGSDMADLLVSLSPERPFDVVLGVPAARWLTPEAIEDLEAALHHERLDDEETKGGDEHRETVVVSSKSASERGMTQAGGRKDDELPAEDDEYRLLGGDDADPSSIRKH